MDAYAHRRGSVTVTLTDTHGQPMPGATATVEQRGHAFGFGNIGFDLVPPPEGGRGAGDFGGATDSDVALLADRWLQVFNHATLPFYWARFEPEQGTPHTARLRAAAEFFVERGVTVKGHPLLWHTLAPRWLMDMPLEEAERTMRARISREVTEFAGLIDLWDAVNEPVILPVFTAEDNAVTRLAQARDRMHVIRLAFETAREANPAARLVLNDFDLSADYESVIEECLEAGVQIDALGLQTHMHQGFRGEEQIHALLERFARFGLPLQMTETTLVSGELMPEHIVDLNDYQVDSWPSTGEGEDRQADELIRHYRTVVAHPAVESLTYWGLTDDGAWLGAPGGLLHVDGTPKPGFDALHDLVRRQWWHAPSTQTADAAGTLTFEGFAGSYAVTWGNTETLVRVSAGEDRDVTVVAPHAT